jgi:hypothetical protein
LAASTPATSAKVVVGVEADDVAAFLVRLRMEKE